MNSLNRGYYYLMGGIAFAIFASNTQGHLLRFLLLWITLSCFWFAIGYLTNRGELFFKSVSGKLPLWMKIFLFPVLIGVHLYNFVLRFFDRYPTIQKLGDGVFVGRRLLPTDSGILKDENIGAILDVTAEFDSLSSNHLGEDVAYFNIPVFDHNFLRLSQLRRAVAWIHQQRKIGKNTLVHCALGQGRSVGVILAYLSTVDRSLSLQEHLDLIKRVKSTANPNRMQIRLIQEFLKIDSTLEKPTAYLIINPVSGNRNNEEKKVEIVEKLHPFLDLDVVETKKHMDANKLARRALEKRYDHVIVAGGDGTVREVAEVLANSGMSLGIIPLGTANALATSVYGELSRFDSINVACQHILSRKSKRIDSAKIGNRRFFLLSGVGFEAGMVEKADHEAKSSLGPVAYLLGGAKQLAEQEKFEVEITADRVADHYSLKSLVIANAAPITSITAQGGGIPDYSDGFLDITIIKSDSKSDLSGSSMAELLEQVIFKNTQSEGIVHLRAQKLSIKTYRKLNWVIDGEVTQLGAQVSIEVDPASLSLMAYEL